MKLRDLLFAVFPDHPAIGGLPDIAVLGVETDSRAVQKDYIFIAIQGVKADGGQFIRDAVLRGALAVVVDKQPSDAPGVPLIKIPDSRSAAARLAAVFYGEPARRMTIVGITGTNGKTTCSYLLEHLFLREQKKCGVIGTVSHRFAGKEIPAAETTPGPVKIQNLLSLMLDSGSDHVAMEVSSHALDQKRADGIDFSAALFTNLTQDHLDYHKTMNEYFEAKAKLFSGLKSSAVAVINADDPWALRLGEKTSARVFTYAVNSPADLKADNILYHEDSTEWEMAWQGKKIRARLPLFGVHNVYNVLGALGVMAGFGFSLQKAVGHLEDFPGVPGRLEALRSGQAFKVFIDFAHTPDGLLNVLKALQDYRKNKLLVVFGCGGDRDRAKRPLMARIASQYADHVYITSDNPRSENAADIAREVCGGFPDAFKDYSVVIDRRKAIRLALLSATEGDVVLLAGKGHERTQIIGDQVMAFSDRDEAQRVLDGR